MHRAANRLSDPHLLTEPHRALRHARGDCTAVRMASRFSAEVIMKNAHKLPRPIRISRKLELSSEKVVLMSQDNATAEVAIRTLRRTGCPIHTC
jgi:hypothetical protein